MSNGTCSSTVAWSWLWCQDQRWSRSTALLMSFCEENRPATQLGGIRGVAGRGTPLSVRVFTAARQIQNMSNLLQAVGKSGWEGMHHNNDIHSKISSLGFQPHSTSVANSSVSSSSSSEDSSPLAFRAGACMIWYLHADVSDPLQQGSHKPMHDQVPQSASTHLVKRASTLSKVTACVPTPPLLSAFAISKSTRGHVNSSSPPR